MLQKSTDTGRRLMLTLDLSPFLGLSLKQETYGSAPVIRWHMQNHLKIKCILILVIVLLLLWALAFEGEAWEQQIHLSGKQPDL